MRTARSANYKKGFSSARSSLRREKYLGRNDLFLLRVPAIRAAGLLQTLREQGIEAEAERVSVRLAVRGGDLDRVVQMLEQIGILYIIETETSRREKHG